MYGSSSYGGYEPNSWYSAVSNFPNSSNPLFVRGGVYGITTRGGLFFYLNNAGNAAEGNGFRPVLIAN